ncbi:transglutaminase domain-containing protein [Frankia sp. AgB1.9]|uniref:DUF3488 and transglutaminase-like domain-containing protein n=1 Tax=unclassified Frankia TaxID=2632575 RepID=UPI0019346521|nr:MULTISPECIES: transglutaminase domain-containing protein [unclassified Frankia]MBL7487586.1 transglutaminase domain-containing protein [Frankia sp. AgW1.1]MBL7548949.1 transglutaminase domain-containing protein [Frankia sp. AgB1.9]MBL7623484.1 transglutaminase domain-containing protein [Frankia sp. AgB1.8]
MTGRTAGEYVLCLAGAALVSRLFGDFFAGAGYLAPLVGAAAVGVVVGAAAGRRGPALLAASYLVGTAALLAALACAAVIVGTPGVGPRAVAGGAAHAWGRMLSVNLPADTEPALMVFPSLLLWTASWLAAALAARTARPAAPAVPLVAAYTLALLLTADRHRDHLWWTTAFLLTLGAMTLARVRAAHPVRVTATTAGAEGARLSGAASGPAVTIAVAAAVTVLALLAAVLPPQLDGGRRFDIRTVDPPPVRVDPGVTPLEGLKASLVAPTKGLFSVRVTAPADVRVDRVRMATLDAYDGVIWSSDDRFLVAGRVLAQAGAGTGRPARIDVVLDDWTGPFLPAIGAPTALGGTDITGPRAGFAVGSGTLVWTGALRQGMAYSVSALVARAGTDLTNARPAQPGPNTGASDPAPPDALRALSASLLGGEGTPYQRLLRLAAAVRARPYSLTAPSGHSSDRLLALMTAPAGSAGGAGYAEQHAAAFALLARLAGFDTRVSVGYLLRRGQDGAYTVTNRDMYAWPEVRFSGYGWVPFEPTDTSRTAPPADDSAAAPRPDTPADQPVTGPTHTGGSGGGGARPPATAGTGRRSPSLARAAAWLSLVLLVLAGAALLACVGILVAKRAQRRRRARGTPAERLAGAWLQALDDLTGHAFLAAAGTRFTVTLADTPGSAAQRAAVAFGPVAASLAGLAARVTALESGGPSPDQVAADQAWADLSVLRRQLDRSSSRRRAGPPGRADRHPRPDRTDRRPRPGQPDGRHSGMHELPTRTDGRLRPLVMARAGLDPRPVWRDAALRRTGRAARRRLEGTGR